MKKKKIVILCKILLSILLIVIILLPLQYKRINCICHTTEFIFDCCDESEWALFWWKYPLTNRKRYYEIQKEDQDFWDTHRQYFQENED